MDTSQWPQDIVVKPMEEIVVTNTSSSCPKPSSLERKVRPQKEQALNCPRCNSTNTKFCYYNNYSLSQPRYFCKSCRRYWTEGGSLRNIPVGGGSRKNKRSSSSSKKLPDLVNPSPSIPQYDLQNPNNIKIHHDQDLNLGFSTPHDFKTINELIQVPNFEQNKDQLANPSTSNISALELLTGITTATTTTAAPRGLLNINSFIQFPINIADQSIAYNPSGGLNMISHHHEFKPSLNFTLDGLGSNYEGFQGVQESSGKLLFPFEDLKSAGNNANDAEPENNRDQNGDTTPEGYWNGVIGGGSW